MRLSWTNFKDFVSSRGVPIHERPLDDGNLLLESFDGPVARYCKIRSGDADYTDYTSNFQSAANPTLTDTEGVPITRSRAFASSDGFRARFKGFGGTATKAVDDNTPTTTKLNHLVSQERYINGVRLILKDAVDGDYVNLQIVDMDGVGVALGWYTQATFDAMGEYVADTFGDNWWVDSSVSTQPDVLVSYPARIDAGLYIRVEYVSTGTVSDVGVKCNMFLHWRKL